MRASLGITPLVHSREPQPLAAPPPVLDPAGPTIVLGESIGDDRLAQPIAPAADTMFGPRGAALAPDNGALVVADTGHHRLLIWRGLPRCDHQPADIVIGQPDFHSEGRNAKGPPGASTLNVPTGVAIEGDVLVVGDAWNHRVLIWNALPQRHNQPADVVLGQAAFDCVAANRGGAPGADTLNWCYGVALSEGQLIVADTGNRRVLVWDTLPTRNGQPADRVLGQNEFGCRDENAGCDPGPLGMRWPHGIARIGRSLLITDAGNNRIMVWRRMPEGPGVPCDFVLGQRDASSLEHNRGRYWPDSTSLNMPYAIATCGDRLLVADTANSRLLGWDGIDLSEGVPAIALTGQAHFSDKGDNRWQMPMRDSLCWPYGIGAAGRMIAIADSGNNRVLLWELAP